jgi:hypothetical protein
MGAPRLAVSPGVRPLDEPMSAEASTAEYAQLAARVLAGADELLARMGAAYQEEILEYADLSQTSLEREVLPVSRSFICEFFSRIVHGTIDPTPASGLSEAARRRLEMGMSLDAPLHAFRVASRIVWQEVVDVADTSEGHLLGVLAATWLDYMDRTSSSFANAYLRASHESLRRTDARRRELLETLVSATDQLDLPAISDRYATPLADRYSPVLLEGDRASVMIDHLLDSAPRGTIGGPRGVRLLLLVPGSPRNVPRLTRPAQPALAAWSRPAAPGAALLREVSQAEAVLAAAKSSGHEQGVFGPDALLPERLLAGNAAVTRALVEVVLEPLQAIDHEGIFRATLRSYLEAGSVPPVARELSVHANTVNYRLRRVYESTGLDPRVPNQAAMLMLALKGEAQLS